MPLLRTHLKYHLPSNVEIYTQSVREQAELARERDLIEGQTQNEQQRQALIDQEIENDRKRQIAKAEIEAQVERIRAEAKAQAIRIVAEAELEAEQERLRTMTDLLQTAGGSAYIDLERARVLRPTDKVIVPTDSRIYLGTNNGLTEVD